MTADLHNKLDQMVSQQAAALEIEHLHLSPYYGETYAEVVNLAAGLDFNFMFAWGPILLPHERILIEVLVYLAREQARGNAFQMQMGGERHEMPIEIYLEKVPVALQKRAMETNQRPPMSLTQLTNLHRLKIYDALKSPNVHHFISQETAQRVFLEGRVMTGPARFRVRVDPVPTPDQAEDIRMRLAQRLVNERLLVMSGIETSLKDSMEPSSTNSVMSPRETSVEDPKRSQMGSRVMSAIETSVTHPNRIQKQDSVMSLWETSLDFLASHPTDPTGANRADSVMSAIETSLNAPLLMSPRETSVMSAMETSLMSAIETSVTEGFRSQNEDLVMSVIETSVMSAIETSLMSAIETSLNHETESECADPRCLPERHHIDVSMFLMQKHRYRNVPEARASAPHAGTEGIYNSVKEKARNMAAKHSGTHSVANATILPSSPLPPDLRLPPALETSPSAPANNRTSDPPSKQAPDQAHKQASEQRGVNAKFVARRPRTAHDGEAPTRRKSVPPTSFLPSLSNGAATANSGVLGQKPTDDEGRESVERWRRETEDLARQSAEALDDQRSLGYHIKVWHHARKVDHQRGGAAHLTSGVFDILNELTRRRHETDSPRPQGKMWTLRTRKWFDDNGFPLLVKADEAELEAVRAALANEFGAME